MKVVLSNIKLAFLFAILTCSSLIGAVPVTSGLVLHLDANVVTGLNDGEAITSWTDSSGSGNSGTAIGNPTYHTNVINGKAVVRFDGDDSFSSPLSTTEDMTIFVITKGSRYWSLIRWQPFNYFVYHWHDFETLIETNNTAGAGIPTGLVTNQWNLGSVIVDTGTSNGVKTYRNGNIHGTTTFSSSWGPLSPLYIGSYIGISEFIIGDIAEVLIYNRALDESEHAEVGLYLANKYNIHVSFNTATNPEPVDGKILFTTDVDLSWAPSGSVDGYNVFFGTDFNEVNEAQAVCIEGDILCDGTVNWLDLQTLANLWLVDHNYYDFAALAANWQQVSAFKGYRDTNSYDPGVLTIGQTYHWRIDEVNGANINRGHVWEFQIIDPSPNQMFPKGSPPADVIDVVNMLYETSDKKLAATTLQGQINKGAESKVFLNLAWWDSPWLPRLSQAGHILNVNNLTMSQYFQKYSDSYDKVIVYDPNLNATINVATMIASLENAIVIHPDDISNYSNGKTVQDLRGLWSTNVNAYQWAFANLWPNMNQNILATYHPTEWLHHMRDYLIRNKVFTFWATDSLEIAFAEQLFAASPVNIPIIGFYDSGAGEYNGVGLAGEYGKLTIACGWTTNMSLYSGISVNIAEMVSEYQNRGVPSCPELDESKVYVSFNIIDCDAPDYWQGIQSTVWQDPNRGKIPIGWGLVSPVELTPSIMKWFYEQAEPNDYFLLPPSGAAYVHPYRNFMGKTPGPEAAWNGYLGLTQHYMNMLDMHEIALYTNSWQNFDRVAQDPVTLRFVNGLENLDTLILGLGRDAGITDYNYLMGESNVLVSHVITRWDPYNIGPNPANNAWLVNEIQQYTPQTRPAFVHVMALCWNYYPSDLLDVLNDLGSDYIAVSVSDLKSLYDQANGL